MRTTTRRGLLAILSALLLILASACGDDGDNGATDVIEASDEGDDGTDGDGGDTDGDGGDTDGDDGEAGGTDGDTDGDDGGDSDGTDDGGTTTGGSASGSPFCRDVADAEQIFNTLDELAFTDPEAIGTAISRARDALQSIDAPAPIATDWALLVNAISEIASLFERVDFSDPQALARIAEDPELMAEFEAMEERFADLDESGERVSAYLQDECGIDLDT